MEDEDWEYADEDEDEEVAAVGVQGDDCGQGDWEYEEEPEVPRKDLQGPYCNTPVTWSPSYQTERAAATLADWIQLMRNRCLVFLTMTPTRDSSILVSLLDQHGLAERGGKRNLQELSLNPISVVKYRGKVDKQGRYHGEGEAWYSNGSLYLGKFQHGVREGPGTLETTVAGVDHCLEGLFTQDR